ncbi:MAG: DUF928 domain-containing protein [Richelia sp. RM2_1_2]|nr:DUF928 domain-containing protein [Richelia sp. RM2_1_2]
MNKKILSISSKVGIKLLSGCILSLMIANTVIAAYTPPKKPSRPRSPVASGGTRGGCSQNPQASLTALAPISHNGKTVSTQPKFAWFVPDTKSYPMELSLYEYNTDDSLKKIKSFDFPSQSGIMSFSISQDKYSLSVGKKYLWQIALRCDTNSPSKDIFVEAEIEVVPMPNNLANQISQITNSIQKARIYGKEGFWYDALSETLKSPQNQEFKLTLLEQLSDLEAKEATIISDNNIKVNLQNQSSHLQKIVEIERQ